MNNAKHRRISEIKTQVEFANNNVKDASKRLSSILSEERDVFDNMEEASDKLDKVIGLLNDIIHKENKIMTNTIILLRGETRLNNSEYKKFTKGDAIWGDNSYPEELKRWNIEQEAEAKAELAKYRCSYTEDIELHNITEYALEYCECDEEGEFVQGSDFTLAEGE